MESLAEYAQLNVIVQMCAAYNVGFGVKIIISPQLSAYLDIMLTAL